MCQSFRTSEYFIYVIQSVNLDDTFDLTDAFFFFNSGSSVSNKYQLMEQKT